ncbi:hypothetical protein LEMLEM_LOCUS15724 [Lemmus lemmus]
MLLSPQGSDRGDAVTFQTCRLLETTLLPFLIESIKRRLLAKMSSGDPRGLGYSTQFNPHHQLERESLVENAPWKNTETSLHFLSAAGK